MDRKILCLSSTFFLFLYNPSFFPSFTIFILCHRVFFLTHYAGLAYSTRFVHRGAKLFPVCREKVKELPIKSRDFSFKSEGRRELWIESSVKKNDFETFPNTSIKIWCSWVTKDEVHVITTRKIGEEDTIIELGFFVNKNEKKEWFQWKSRVTCRTIRLTGTFNTNCVN